MHGPCHGRREHETALSRAPRVDEYYTRTDSASVRNFLTDALGSTVALTDGSETVQTSYTYEPFGRVTTSGAVGLIQFRGRFSYVGSPSVHARSYIAERRSAAVASASVRPLVAAAEPPA